ncbi:MAG: flagellar hook-associated protein FlgL [Peptococcaceae bacterium]|nr:flagellar hook-associated protein FlgL [Peptococcaceae bacterium]
MRITQNMMTNTVVQNLQTNLNELNTLNDQIASGKNFSVPSDNPLGVLDSMQLTDAVNANTQYIQNANQGMSLLNSADGSLGNLTTIINRVNDLAVQGASDTLTTQDRMSIAQEVAQLQGQVMSIANTDVAGNYIFAGTNNNTPPMTSTTSGATTTYTWSGNSNPAIPSTQISYQIGANTNLQVNVDGSSIFGTTAPTGATSSLMQTMTNLISDLQSGNGQQISSRDIGDIQANLDNVLQVRTDIGARVNRIQSMQNTLTGQNTNLQELLSNVQNVDLAQAITQMESQKETYTASLQASAQILQPTLLQFLS